MLSLFRKTLWLVADDPDQQGGCDCRQGVVDASWHDPKTHPAGGTGWLWSCCQCSRAFLTARAARISGTLEGLAKKQTPRVRQVMQQEGAIIRNVLLAGPDDWLKVTRPIAEEIELGEQYVYFDGRVFPAIPGPIRFRGLWRDHDLPELPHLSDRLIEEVLGNPGYWGEAPASSAPS